jgi:hypothetical protein
MRVLLKRPLGGRSANCGIACGRTERGRHRTGTVSREFLVQNSADTGLDKVHQGMIAIGTEA